MKTLIASLIVILATATTIQAQWADFPDPLFANSSLGSVQVLSKSNVWAIDYDNNVVVKTSNGGLTWTALPVADPSFADYWIESISVIDANTAWLTAMSQPTSTLYSRTYKTTDGGATWQLKAAFTNHWATANHFFDANNGINLGLTQWPSTVVPLILITNNGGTNWSMVSLFNLPTGSQPISSRAFSVINNTIWYIGLDAWVYKSSDMGQTWSAVNPGFPTAPSNAPKSIAFIDANNGLAASQGTLKRTTDGGDTWITVNPNGTWKSDEIAAVPGKTSTYISAGRSTGNMGSYVSYDNGDSWLTIETTNQHYDIHFIDPYTGWSGGQGKMLKFDSNVLGTPKDLTNANSFYIYPNPSKGTYFISPSSTQPFSLEVYDALGRQVIQQQGNSFGQNMINLTGKNKGFYLVHILSGEQRIIEKIILQ